jgi:hypothetical protein
MGKVIYLIPRALSRTRAEPPRGIAVLVNVLTVVGAILIIAASIYTSRRLEDWVVFAVLVPGVLSGLVLIVAAMLIGRRHGYPASGENKPGKNL